MCVAAAQTGYSAWRGSGWHHSIPRPRKAFLRPRLAARGSVYAAGNWTVRSFAAR